MEGISRKAKAAVFGGAFALAYPLFNFFLHPIYNREPNAETKTAIVTGASGNLGAAICYHLANRKMRIIMACRDMDKCQLRRRELVLATGHKGIACRHLDLEDIDSINKFVKEIEKTEPHVNILINNAGVKHVETKEMTKYGIEKNYFVNFVGPYLLTLGLMNKLKESASNTRDSRIVNMVGTPRKNWDVDLEDINFDKRPYNPKTAYNQSKLALAYFTILLNKLNREEKNCIYVYACSPTTNLINDTFLRPVGVKENLQFVATAYYSHNAPRLVSPVVKCALDPELRSPNRTGKLYSYFLSSWGWGKADKDERKAYLVWNAAANTLLNLQNK